MSRTVILRDRLGYETTREEDDPLPKFLRLEGKVYQRTEGVLYVEVEVKEIHDTRRSFRIDDWDHGQGC